MPAQRFVADDFVDAAMSLLAKSPAGNFTLKEVGKFIDADTTAVYRYFRSKEALLSAMVDRVLADLVAPGQPVDDPRQDLDRIALGIRDIHLHFPMLAATIAGVEIIAPNAIRLSQRVIDDLVILGLSGDRLVTAYQSVENFVLGSNWNDGVGKPDNWEIRRQRYALTSRAAFSDLTAREVAELSQRSYLEGLQALLDTALRGAGR